MKRGLRPAPGAQAANRRRSPRDTSSAGPTAAYPSSCASSSKRDQSERGQGAGNEVRERKSVVRDERLLLGGESCSPSPGPRHRAGRPGAAVPRSAGSPPRGCRAASIRPPRTRSELLDEVEREPVAPVRARRDDRMSSSTVSPGSITLGSGARTPSHTIGFPSGSSQWYASWTPSCPRERHAADPAFSSRSAPVPSAPARARRARRPASGRRAAPRARRARRLVPSRGLV